MNTQKFLDFSEKIFFFILVIPIYVGLLDAFFFAITGYTYTGVDWTWQRILAVLIFYCIRLAHISSKKEKK